MAEVPGADDLGFTLVPADDEPVSADAELDAVEAEALAAAGVPAEGEDAPLPFGRSWAFDFERSRFVRQGGSPARVEGIEALKMWCLVAMSSARYAHAVFSEEFGMEGLNDSLGQLDPQEVVSDLEERIRGALMVHDRIMDVTDFSIVFDRTTGIVTVQRFSVVTDEEVELPFGDLQFLADGGFD